MINLSTNKFDITPALPPESATRNTAKANIEEDITIDKTLTNDLCDDLLAEQHLLGDTEPTLSSMGKNGMQGMNESKNWDLNTPNFQISNHIL